jgi:hypothetical protein
MRHPDPQRDRLRRAVVGVRHGEDPGQSAAERVVEHGARGLRGVAVPPGVGMQVPSDLDVPRRQERALGAGGRQRLEERGAEPPAGDPVRDRPDAVDGMLERGVALDPLLGLGAIGHHPGHAADEALDLPARVHVEDELDVVGTEGAEAEPVGRQYGHPSTLRPSAAEPRARVRA